MVYLSDAKPKLLALVASIVSNAWEAIISFGAMQHFFMQHCNIAWIYT